MATLAQARTQLRSDLAAAKVIHRTARRDMHALLKALMVATVISDVSATGRQILRDLLAAEPSPLLRADYNASSLSALERRNLIQDAGAGEFEFTAAARLLITYLEA